MAAQREWFEKDYYKTLGVAATATPSRLGCRPSTGAAGDTTTGRTAAARTTTGGSSRTGSETRRTTKFPSAPGVPGAAPTR